MILRATVAAVVELLEAEPDLAARLRRALGWGEESAPAGASPLLDRAGLARQLGVCPDTVDKLRREPNFPEVRVGDVPRFEPDRVLAWLRARTEPGLRAIPGGRRGG